MSTLLSWYNLPQVIIEKVCYVLVSILEKMYLCKKQVNKSYFKGIDETEDYTTVETLER